MIVLAIVIGRTFYKEIKYLVNSRNLRKNNFSDYLYLTLQDNPHNLRYISQLINTLYSSPKQYNIRKRYEGE